MPTVRIDDEVYKVLQDRAEAFIDSPNSVLRRMLGLDPSGGEPEGAPDRGALAVGSARRNRRTRRQKSVTKRRRAPAGALLPEERYELPLLRCLLERGGTAPAREVIQAVGEVLAAELTEMDRQPLPSGGIRWQNRVQFVRLRLIEKGLLRGDSPRGTWELTSSGSDAAEAG